MGVVEAVSNLCLVAWIVLQVAILRWYPDPRPASPSAVSMWGSRHPFQLALVAPVFLTCFVLLPLAMMIYEVEHETSVLSTVLFSTLTVVVVALYGTRLWRERNTGRPREYFLLQLCAVVLWSMSMLLPLVPHS
jgi:drug/metabolite transporter (DMT)-like permease